MSKEYHVEFAIEVSADTPEEACKRAWDLLSGKDAMLPVGTVLELESGDREDIDLQELQELQEEHCYKCDADLGDGEGYDGLCGNCADRTEPKERDV